VGFLHLDQRLVGGSRIARDGANLLHLFVHQQIEVRLNEAIVRLAARTDSLASATSSSLTVLEFAMRMTANLELTSAMLLYSASYSSTSCRILARAFSICLMASSVFLISFSLLVSMMVRFTLM